MTTKICTCCKEERPKTDFYKKKVMLFSQCKRCTLSKQKKYAENNKEKIKERAGAYREKNREIILKKSRDFLSDKENRERKNRLHLEWKKKNKEKIQQKSRIFYLKNKEKIKTTRKQWLKNNKAIIAVQKQNRRSRERNNKGKLSKDLAETLYKSQNGICACCEKSLEEGYHLDHIMPLALGGLNIDSNMQLLTPKCNLQKGWKHPDEYIKFKHRIINEQCSKSK
jgi:hypothetical protein